MYDDTIIPNGGLQLGAPATNDVEFTPVRVVPEPFVPVSAEPVNTLDSGKRFYSRATGYFPTPPNHPAHKMEGGYKDREGRQIYTLDAYRRGEVPYVTVAMDSDALPYNTEIRSPQFPGVPFRVRDTGGAFKGKGVTRIDIARDTNAAANDDENNQVLQFEVVGRYKREPRDQKPPKEEPFVPASEVPLEESGSGRFQSAMSTFGKTLETGIGTTVRGIGSVAEMVGDAVRGGNDEAVQREINQLNEAIRRTYDLPPGDQRMRIRRELEVRLMDLLDHTKLWGGIKDAGHKAGTAIQQDAQERFVPNEAYRGEFFADTVPEVGGGAVASVAPYLIPYVGPVVGTSAAFAQTFEDTLQQNRQEGVDDKTAYERALLNGVVSGGLEMVGDRVVAGGMKKIMQNAGKKGLMRVGESVISEGLTGAAQEAAQQIINEKDLDFAEIAKEGAKEALGGFMLSGGTLVARKATQGERGRITEWLWDNKEAGMEDYNKLVKAKQYDAADRKLRELLSDYQRSKGKAAPASAPAASEQTAPQDAPQSVAGMESVTLGPQQKFDIDPLSVEGSGFTQRIVGSAGAPGEQKYAPQITVIDEAVRRALVENHSFPKGMVDSITTQDASAILAEAPGSRKSEVAVQNAMRRIDEAKRNQGDTVTIDAGTPAANAPLEVTVSETDQTGAPVAGAPQVTVSDTDQTGAPVGGAPRVTVSDTDQTGAPISAPKNPYLTPVNPNAKSMALAGSLFMPQLQPMPAEEAQVAKFPASRLSKQEIGKLLPFTIMGVKTQLLSADIGGMLETAAKESDRIIDAFGGAGTYTHYLRAEGLGHEGDILNEYEPLRFIAHKQIRDNPQAVVAEVEKHNTAIERLLAPIKDGADFDEAAENVRNEVGKYFREQSAALLVPGQNLELLGRNKQPVQLKDDAATAGFYLVAQNYALNSIPMQGELSQRYPGMLKMPGFVAVGNVDEQVKLHAGEAKRVQSVRSYVLPAADRFKGLDVRQGDGWALIRNEARKGDLIPVDTSYLNKSDDTKTTNYNTATAEDAVPEVYVEKIRDNLLPAWDRGAKLVITNNWDDNVAGYLRGEGFTVLAGERSKATGSNNRELIAINFDPNTGRLYRRRENADSPVAPSTDQAPELRGSGDPAATETQGLASRTGEEGGTPDRGRLSGGVDEDADPELTAEEKEMVHAAMLQARAEMDEDLREATEATSVGLGKALERAGGLPSPKSKYFAEWKGELGMLIEGRIGARKAAGNPRLFENLFSAEAKSMDTVVEALQEEGFSVHSAPDVFEMVDDWLRGGREPRATVTKLAQRDDVPFSMSTQKGNGDNNEGDGRDTSRVSKTGTGTPRSYLQAAANDIRAGAEAILRIRPEFTRHRASLAALYEWARANDKIVDAPILKTPPWKEGMEHEVWLAENQPEGEPLRLTKATRANHAGMGFFEDATVSEYLERLDIQNQWFGDDTKLEGVAIEGGKLRIITTQPMVQGSEPGQKELAAFLKTLGFAPLRIGGRSIWYSAKHNLALTDVHTGNFVKRSGNKISPIDVVMAHPSGRLLNAIQSAASNPSYSQGLTVETGTDGATIPIANQQLLANQFVSNWATPPEVRVVSSVAAIPEGHIRSLALSKEREGGRIEAFHQWINGRSQVTIIGSAVTSQQRLHELILHEGVGHGGLQSLFKGKLKERYRSITEGIWNSIRDAKQDDAWAEKHGYSTLTELAERYGYDTSTVAGRARVIEEHLSRMAETGNRPGWFAQAIARVRDLIRQVSPFFQNWNQGDVLNLIHQARNAVQGNAAAAGVSFSIAPERFSPEDAEQAAQRPEKRREFIQSVKDAAAIAPEIKERIESVYEPITNAETMDAAKARINEIGIDGALAEVFATNAQNQPTALSNTMAIELLGRLQTTGRFEDAGRLAEHVATQATTQGQAIQALSMLSRLSPEGVQVYAQKIIQSALQEQNDPMLAKLAEEVARIKKELSEARKGHGTKAVLEIQPELKDLGLDPETLSNIQQEIREILVTSEDEPIGDEANVDNNSAPTNNETTVEPTPHPDTPPAVLHTGSRLFEKIKSFKVWSIEMVKRFGATVKKYLKRLWDSLTFKALAPHARERGSAINPIAAMKEAMENKKRDAEQKKKEQRERSKEQRKINPLETIQAATPADRQDRLAEAVKQSIAEPGNAKSRIVGILIGAGMDRAKAEKLARAALNRYKREARKARETLLKQMLKVPREKIRIPKGEMEKWMKLNELGALTDEKMYGAIAKKMGMPVFTREMARRIQSMQRAYEAAPAGDIKLVKGAEMLEAIHETVPVSFWSKVKATQNMAMLLNPKTAIRNVGGNALLFAADITADTVGGWIVDPFVSFVTGKRTRTSANVGARLQGLKAPLKDFWNGYNHAAQQGQKTGLWRAGVAHMVAMARLTSARKFEVGDINKHYRHTFTSPALRLLEDGLTTMLGVPDRAFHQAAFAASITRQMEIANRAGTQVVSPTMEMIAEAKMDAAKATFQDENFLSKYLPKIVQAANRLSTFGITDRYGIGTVVLPFTQVPGSIFVQTAEWSPLGFIRSAYELGRPLARKEFNQKKFVDSFTRALLGTAVWQTGFWLFKLGVLSALPEEDDEAEKFRKSAGLGGYRINVSELKRRLMSGNWHQESKGAEPGDLLVNYDWLQPNAGALAAGAERAHATDAAAMDMKRGKLAQMPSTIMLQLNAGARTLEEQALLSGLSRLAKDVGHDGVITGAAKQYFNAPSNFTPTVLAQITQLADNRVYETRSGSPIDHAIGQVATRIPGLAAKLYPPKQDLYGQAQERYQARTNTLFNVFMNPAFASRASSDPAIRELNSVFSATGERGAIPKTVPPTVEINGRKMELTNEQIATYQRFVGQTSMTLINSLTESPKFEALPDSVKAKIFADVFSDSNGAAKVLLFGHRPKGVDQGVVTQAVLGRRMGLEQQVPR